MVAPLSAPVRRAHFLPLALRAALALLLLAAGAGPAWAQAVRPAQVSIGKTVVAPRGMVTARFEAELRCTSPSGPTQVRVALTAGRPAVSRVPVGADCVVVERPGPVPAGNSACPFPAWAPPQYSPSANFTAPQSKAVIRIVITNRLICRPAGTLLLAKTTVSPPGVKLAFSAVTVDVDCSPAGPKASLAVPANGQARPFALPAGVACTVTERIPAASADCSWGATQIPPGAVTAAGGGTVTVRLANTLTCARPGRLIIVKQTNPAAGIPPLSPRFLVRCRPAGPNSRVPIPASGRATVSGIPAGSLCTVTEEIPRSLVPNCSWTPSQSPPGDAAISSGATVTVTVTNDWVCRPGAILIKKTTISTSTEPTPAAFTVDVNCGAGRPARTVSVPAAGEVLVDNIAAGSVCTVVEQAPPPGKSGCVWSASQNPAGSILVGSGATATVTLANKLTCADGSIVITKNTIPSNAGATLASVKIDVRCSPAGPNTTVSVPGNGTATVERVPASSTCTITEQIPPPPPNTGGCDWTPTQIPDVTVQAGEAAKVTITNRLVCVGPGHIMIRKTISPPAALALASVMVDVKCSAGSHPPVSVPVDGFGMAHSLPKGSVCTLSEQAPPTRVPGCAWTATQEPPGTITVVGNTTVQVTLVNRLVCAQTGSLRIKARAVHPSGVAGPTSVSVKVHCSPGPVTTVMVPIDGETLVADIPVPATCFLVERVPPADVHGCGWEVGENPNGPIAIVSGGTATMTLTNTWFCFQRYATLTVRKFLLIEPDTEPRRPPSGRTDAVQGGFPVIVTCPLIPPIEGAMNFANNHELTVPVPDGVICKVEETPPPPIDPLCIWSPIYRSGPNVWVRDGGGTIEIVNHLVCDVISIP